jgi:hypothetical protein
MYCPSRLYETRDQVLRQQEKGFFLRHLYTLAWMIVGLIQSSTVSLTAWVPYVNIRARYAQSTQRRFARWLNNKRIFVHSLSAPLILSALQSWGEDTISLTLDTTVLFNHSCLIRLAIVARGRAVPLVWQGRAHRRATVAFLAFHPLPGANPSFA